MKTFIPNYNEARRTIHHRIGNYIRSHSTLHCQDYDGAYHILLLTPTFWFLMDDFNNQISLHWGEPPKPEEIASFAVGVRSNELCYLGIDFGGYESKLSHAQYMEVAALIP